MAKGQKRSNREPKKPKQVKKSVEAPATSSLVKGIVLVNGRNNRR